MSIKIIEAKSFPRALVAGTRDVLEAVAMWQLWLMLGLHEIKQRYRRSTLGALWITLNMAVQAFIMGYLLGALFDHNMNKFLPYVCLSLVLWGYLSGTVNDATNAFIGNSATIMQFDRPFFVYIMLVTCRNVIIVAHTILIYFLIAFYHGDWPSLYYLQFIPGFLLGTLNILWIALIASILATRFRDVQLIVQNCFNALFWLTPVVYLQSQLSGRRLQILQFNPLMYVLDVMRAPLLNEPVPALSWIVASLLAVVGWAVALILFARTRHRISYWL